MSSRTVSVVLTAQVQNYLTEMKAAERQTLEVEKASRTATQQFRIHNEALTKVGVGFAAVGATAAAGLAIAIRASTDFGAKMAQLQALSHASAGTMKQLSDAAMTVGTAYGFSATQVADAQIELVKAGVSVKDQLGGALKGALTLAAAGQMDVAQATEITTVAMTQFGLSAGQVPHLADLLAAGADKALGSVADLGEGLKNGGLQAHNMGLSIDDTVGLLSAFANQGILGAEAGTQIRSMFLRLENPMAASKKTMSEYGIAINDASGKFVGITKFAGELHDKLGGLTQAQRNAALATMFGSHAIIGATALYQYGAAGIAKWIAGVNDTGFASAQAAGKMNSLQGDVTKLSAAFQTDLIKAGSAATGPLRGIVESATGAVTALGGLPPVVQSGVMAAGALVAGVGLLGGALLVAVPKIAATRMALKELGTTGRGVAGMVGKGSALAIGIVSLGSLLAGVAQQGQATSQQIELAGRQVTGGSWKGIDKLFGAAGNAVGAKSSLDSLASGDFLKNNAGFFETLDTLTFGFTHLGDVFKTNAGQYDALGQQLSGLAKLDYSKATDSFSGLVKQLGGGKDTARELLQVMPAYREELVALAGKAHVAATDQNLLLIAQGKGGVSVRVLAAAQADASAATAKQAAGLAVLDGQASSAVTSIDSLQKAIEGFGSAQLDARSATRAMYQAIDDATAAAVKNGATLDVHTQKGRDNQAALDGIATAADNAASKILKQTGDTKKAAAAMQTGRDAYIRTAEAMGMSAGKAKALADRLGLIPRNVTTAVRLTGQAEALRQADILAGRVKNLDKLSATISIALDTTGAAGAGTIGQVVRNALLHRASGGPVPGTGPKGVDSVPAILAPGEHVLTAGEVDRMGGQGGVYAFRAALASGGIQHYARGGAVSAITAQNRTADDAQRTLTRQYATLARAKAKAKAKAARKHTTANDAAVTKAQAAVAKAQAAVTATLSRRDTARAAVTTLRQSREDFVSAERRTPGRNVSDPLAYVDELRSESRDGNYSAARRKGFDTAANRYESALVKLAASSTKASATLDTLKQSSTQLHDSITQAISGGYQASAAPLTGAHDASTRSVASGWITRNGIRLRNYSTVAVAADPGHVTAGGIAAYYTHGAAAATRFATDLATLAKRGLNPTLLSEIAGYGVAQGQPIVAALLSGSASQLGQVNAGYKGIAAAAGRAGTTVADDNYAAQIRAAQKNADQITGQIKSDGEKLRKLIASAFGLKGYAGGTSSAEGGIRWVGENGPELVGFRGGEKVLNRGDSARWVRGAPSGGSAAGQPVEVHVAPFPDTITVADASGFTATMRVVAHQVVSQRNDQLAVRVMGAA